MCDARKTRESPMKKLDPTMAQQVAQAISVFQQQRTGFPPKAVTVVLSDDTLVVTLHEVRSPAEKALASTPEAPPRCRSFTDSSSGARSTCRERRSSASRGSRGRGSCGSGDDDRPRRACIHDGPEGAAVPARRRNLCGGLEREWTERISHRRRRFNHASLVEVKRPPSEYIETEKRQPMNTQPLGP